VGTEDGRFEMFGPRVDNVLIKMYMSDVAEWEALRAGQIDITDWRLTKTYYDDFMDGSDPDVAVADNGGELDMWVLDINNNAYINDGVDPDKIGPPGDPTDTPNPLGDETLIEVPPGHPYLPAGTMVTRGSQARLALAHLLDREAIINATGNMHKPMYTHIPNSTIFRIDGWINENVYKYPFNPQLASSILTMAGYSDTDSDGWFNDPRTGANINLDFLIRTDTFRKTIADWIEARSEGTPGGSIPNLRDYGPGILVTQVLPPWWGWRHVTQFHLRTGGWILNRAPTYYYGLYNSKSFWHPGDPPNYFNVHDPEIDRLSELLYFAPDIPTAKQAALDLQTRMNEPDAVFNIPVANSMGRKAFKKTHTDNGTYWHGFINSPGYGISTGPAPGIDTFLNAHPEGMDTGGTIRQGWRYWDMPTSVNPYSYSWFWDADVIFKMYNTLLAVNPYDPVGGGPGEYPPGDLPWMAKSWEIGTWSPDGGVSVNSRFTFYLRDDVYFHDGTLMTAKDVYYTVQFGHWQAIDHPDYGWTGIPPWFWSSIMDITPEFNASTGEVIDVMGVGVDMPDGPDGFRVVFNYNIQSIWALWRAGAEIPVTPKHKWWDRFVPNPTGSDRFAPDPQMIGTGPFQVYPGSMNPPDGVHYDPTLGFIKLDKNPTFFNRYQLVTAALEIRPRALNLMSRGKWIAAYIELLGGFDVGGIDVSSIRLNGTVLVDSAAPTVIGDYDGDGAPDLTVKFVRADVTSFIFDEMEIPEFAYVTLAVTGRLINGLPFGGHCTIKVVCMMYRKPMTGMFPI